MPKNTLLRFDDPEPEEGRQVLRYGNLLTREGDLWVGEDSHGNPGACTWKELFDAFGTSDFVVLVDA